MIPAELRTIWIAPKVYTVCLTKLTISSSLATLHFTNKVFGPSSCYNYFPFSSSMSEITTLALKLNLKWQLYF